jgi:hypothetical protein
LSSTSSVHHSFETDLSTIFRTTASYPRPIFDFYASYPRPIFDFYASYPRPIFMRRTRVLYVLSCVVPASYFHASYPRPSIFFLIGFNLAPSRFQKNCASYPRPIFMRRTRVLYVLSCVVPASYFHASYPRLDAFLQAI